LVPLNDSVLDYFFAYPHLLPAFTGEEQEGKKLFFWGTEYECGSREVIQTHVPYLSWSFHASGPINVSAGTKHLNYFFGPDDVAVCYDRPKPAQ
jgi:hypothetical protein